MRNSGVGPWQTGDYYQTALGLYIPANMPTQPSGNQAVAVNETGYYNPRSMSLKQFAIYQLLQTRRKYFLLHEMYRQDTWVRATIDYIVRRIVRDEIRLVDKANPEDPDIEDIQEWLDNCFPDGDFYDIIGGVVQDLIEFGQAYCFIERDRRGNPLHLWPMDSRICFPITDFSGAILFHAQVYAGYATFFHKDEVLYFGTRNNGANPKAIPSLETLYDSVAMELSANQFNAALFENNLNIGAVFAFPAADDDTIEENRRYLADHFAGAENAYSPLLLTGDRKLLRDGAMATKDINFELLIRVARHRVSAVLGIPESLLGIPDNTNRATSQTHERTAYKNTIQPTANRIYRGMSRQLIGRTLGHPHIAMREPLLAMLGTQEDLTAVEAVAKNGINFNDYLEMTGRPRVANGNYWVYQTPNSMMRLDTTAMPGLDDPNFSFQAYERQHQADQQRQEQMSAMGLQAAGGGGSWVPPRAQDSTQTDPTARRIIDLSRGFHHPLDCRCLTCASHFHLLRLQHTEGMVSRAQVEDMTGWTVERRTPMRPGSRGSTNAYQTKTGGWRYGKPANTAPPKQPSDSGANTLTNPRDVPAPKTLPPDIQTAMGAAHSEVDGLFQQRQVNGWTNEQFFEALTKAGWNAAAGTAEQFADVSYARAEAWRLAQDNTTSAFRLIGADGQYFLLEKPLDQAGDSLPAIHSPRASRLNVSDTGNMHGDKKGREDSGNSGKADTGNPLKHPATDTGNTNKFGRSLTWQERITALGGTNG